MLGYKAPDQLARCWKVLLITARAGATLIETRSIFSPAHAPGHLPKIATATGIFQHTSKTATKYIQNVLNTTQGAYKLWIPASCRNNVGVYGGIAFRAVSCVTSADDRARIISGLSIKCFNIGEKRKITPVKSRIIWENVGLLPRLCDFDGIGRCAARLIWDAVESNEDSSQQRMVRNPLFTGSNHMYSLQLITMPSVVAVVVVGYDLE